MRARAKESTPAAALDRRIVFMERADVARQVAELAQRHGTTLGGEIRRALREHLDREQVRSA